MKSVFVLFLIVSIALLCTGCSIHESCNEEIFELQVEIEQLQDEMDDMYDRISSYRYAMEEIRSALITSIEYYEGNHDSIRRDEAIGGLYYAVDISRTEY